MENRYTKPQTTKTKAEVQKMTNLSRERLEVATTELEKLAKVLDNRIFLLCLTKWQQNRIQELKKQGYKAFRKLLIQTAKRNYFGGNAKEYERQTNEFSATLEAITTELKTIARKYA